MTRHSLPNRRASVTFSLPWQGVVHEVSLGLFDDGTPAEVFISGTKSGSDIQAVSRDAAILLSLALQHGVALDVIRRSVTRGEDEKPQSILGAVVDAFAVTYLAPEIGAQR